MKICVCYFLGKHSYGGEKHLSGPPKGSGGKKLFSGPPKGSRRRGGERREKVLLWTTQQGQGGGKRVFAKFSCPSALSINKTPACCVGIIVSTLN